MLRHSEMPVDLPARAGIIHTYRAPQGGARSPVHSSTAQHMAGNSFVTPRVCLFGCAVLVWGNVMGDAPINTDSPFFLLSILV